MATNGALALDFTAHAQAKGIRRGEEFLDSLAYIEKLDDADRSKAEALIKEEMKTMGKRREDYLSELPKLHQVKFPDHPLLQAEYDRVKAGLPMPVEDRQRLSCPAPPENRKNDVSAWHTALDNAHSQLEHQYNRLQNMELAMEYGTKSWQAYIRWLEIESKRMERVAGEKSEEINAVNQRRQLKHKAAGKELEEIHREWTGIIAKNMDIAKACAGLDAEIAALQDKLPESEKPKIKENTEGVKEDTDDDNSSMTDI